MADDFDSKARAIAKYVRDELFNSGVVTLDEARSLVAAENSNATEFSCAACHAESASWLTKRLLPTV